MSFPWMAFSVADYRRDTGHLDAAEHGAYLLLIMHYWSTGGLPDDDRQLARIAAMTPAQWRRTRPVMQAFFRDGWRHKRIDFELAKAANISSKRSTAARQRHGKRAANAPAFAEQMDAHARAESQTQTQEQEESSLRSAAPLRESPLREARPRATRLPADWAASEQDLDFARQNGLSPAECRTEAEKFRNYWIAKAGRDAAKLDWAATWRNWILNATERKGRTDGQRRGDPGGGARSDFFAGLASVAEDIAGERDVAMQRDPAIPAGRFAIEP